LTAPNILHILDRSEIPFEALYAVPLVLKFMTEHSLGIPALQKLKLVTFGGSALPDEIGNKLVDNGIRIVSHYGTSEY
jgi:hypothetical protein